ncbi:MAG: dockerin type I domain-containing protein, partial [Chloroflexota bacterium]
MKKVVVFWLSLLLVVTLTNSILAWVDVEMIARARASAPLRFHPQSETAATLRVLTPAGALTVGQSILVEIEINTREETRALSMGLSFNPSVLRLDEIIEGPFYSSWAAANGALTLFNRGAINNTTGMVGDSYIALLGGVTPTPFPTTIPTPTLGPFMPGANGQGVVMRFRFTTLANGVSPINILAPIVADNRSQVPRPLSLTVIHAQVIVGPTPEVTLTPTHTPTVTLTPTPSPTRTPTPTPYPTANLTVVCPAVDFNGDGFVDLLDIQQLISRIGQTGSAGWIAEDVNRDGIVDVRDLTMIGPCLGWSLTPLPTLEPRTAALRVSPLQQTIKTGQTVNVDIVLDVNTISSGAQAGLRFDPSLLRCEQVEEGDFYQGWIQVYYPGAATVKMPDPRCDNETGQVSVGGIYLNGVPPGDGPQGTGSLWRIRFTALRTGTTTLHLADGAVRDGSVPI